MCRQMCHTCSHVLWNTQMNAWVSKNCNTTIPELEYLQHFNMWTEFLCVHLLLNHFRTSFSCSSIFWTISWMLPSTWPIQLKSVWVSEWVSEKGRECECVSQWVSEWVSEWASEWVGEWVDDSRSLLLWLTFPVVPLQFSHQSVSRVSVDRYQVPHEMIACRLRYETEKREGGKLPNVTNPEHQSNNVTSVQVLLHQLTNL